MTPNTFVIAKLQLSHLISQILMHYITNLSRKWLKTMKMSPKCTKFAILNFLNIEIATYLVDKSIFLAARTPSLGYVEHRKSLKPDGGSLKTK